MGEATCNREVIICYECDGKGFITKSVLTDYHKGEYDSFDHFCKKCKGSGRIIKTTTTNVTEEPFSSDEEKIQNLKAKELEKVLKND